MVCERDYIYEFCMLVDMLIKNIRHLEVETVRARFELSRYLPPPHNVYLRAELVSDLSGCYSDYTAYHIFTRLFHDGQDPMNSTEWANNLLSYTQGHGGWPWNGGAK